MTIHPDLKKMVQEARAKFDRPGMERAMIILGEQFQALYRQGAINRETLADGLTEIGDDDPELMAKIKDHFAWAWQDDAVEWLAPGGGSGLAGLLARRSPIKFRRGGKTVARSRH